MAVETLYADAHLAGDVTNPDNATGNTPSTWAGVVNVNTSATSRWSIADPVDPLAAGETHTINVVSRKGSNTNNPSVTVNLYDNGTLVKTLVASTTITSTTGQTLSGTFTTAEVSNGNNVEVEVAISGTGGSGTARNSAQISTIEASLETAAAAPTGSFVRLASGLRAPVRLTDGTHAVIRLASGARL